MSKYIYNTTEEDIIYVGKTIPTLEYYLIPSNMELKFSNDDTLLTDISNSVVIVSKTEDSSGHINSINLAIDFLKNNLPKTVESTLYPFAAKVLSNGKRLYTRIHGASQSVAGAPDNIDFTIPYASCKLTGIEIFNGEKGDKVNFKVLDTSEGIISGIPNYVLNQFGFNVNIADGYYKFTSNYDADLIQNMKLRIEFDAITSDLLPKNIYVNFILHEVVD